MNQAAHQEPRAVNRQRYVGLPHVDVTDAAAAGELVLTIHIKTGHDYGSLGIQAGRAPRPAGFRRAIAAAVQGVVDELMPFPAAQAPAAAAEQAFEGADAAGAAAEGAEAASASQEVGS